MITYDELLLRMVYFDYFFRNYLKICNLNEFHIMLWIHVCVCCGFQSFLMNFKVLSSIFKIVFQKMSLDLMFRAPRTPNQAHEPENTQKHLKYMIMYSYIYIY